ncbi:polynucleotide adenylyltransferase PcnB, partial [Streptomyces sp. PRKS01-65]|nr:polynucleotide adenylyltransferase PcnB [Streptomyces harenosi]
VTHLRFRAGFDFLRLRADVGEVDEALADWWQEFQLADEARREDMIDQVREEQKQRARKNPPVVRSVPKPAAPADESGAAAASGAAAPAADGLPDDAEGSAEGSAVKKRRRRRRKPSGGGEGAPPAAPDA